MKKWVLFLFILNFGVFSCGSDAEDENSPNLALQSNPITGEKDQLLVTLTGDIQKSIAHVEQDNVLMECYRIESDVIDAKILSCSGGKHSPDKQTLFEWIRFDLYFYTPSQQQYVIDANEWVTKEQGGIFYYYENSDEEQGSFVSRYDSNTKKGSVCDVTVNKQNTKYRGAFQCDALFRRYSAKALNVSGFFQITEVD